MVTDNDLSGTIPESIENLAALGKPYLYELMDYINDIRLSSNEHTYMRLSILQQKP